MMQAPLSRVYRLRSQTVLREAASGPAGCGRCCDAVLAVSEGFPPLTASSGASSPGEAESAP